MLRKFNIIFANHYTFKALGLLRDAREIYNSNHSQPIQDDALDQEILNPIMIVIIKIRTSGDCFRSPKHTISESKLIESPTAV